MGRGLIYLRAEAMRAMAAGRGLLFVVPGLGKKKKCQSFRGKGFWCEGEDGGRRGLLEIIQLDT